ncbi:MAG: methionyl-tRNA formyltransferase [Paracoccaceae bacterium]|jgi:methionyl-tRNA formyltransferase
MRIVVHGQQAFGKSVLERLLERGEDIIAVCCAPTKEDRPEDPMADLARENNIPVHQPASWKTPEALDLMQSFNADLCMMAYVLLFVPEAVLNAPKHGTFQYHPSLCPEHRGPSSINWPIAMGKTRTGLTIFWPNDGLDEGPIMIQKSCEIGPDDTIGDVYFKKLFPMGVDAMIEGLDLVKSGVILKHDQRLKDGSYESWFKGEQAAIDWSKPVADVYNIIRAANPAPGASCEIKGVAVQVYDSKRLEGAGAPGEVVSVEDNGIVVQANGGRILIERLKPKDGKKQPAAEWINGLG